ncbi:endolysin [Mycobacterium phage Brocalys]|uniref:endolysin n=1 Tax=Mycobacterium phage Brocalys TaxID=1815608 RepID=UPI00078D9B53|nr:endolysin [Mycobacterium phage Brocalys]AMS01732.1 lysin A [Mycobacterium phage Brocalys]ASJ79623.1 lysin A [Mycobacterium phage Pippy]
MTTKDQVAQLTITEARARGYTRDETLAIMSTFYQESGWSETIWDPTHTTYGIAQQDGSYPNRFDGAAAQIKGFFDKLDVWRRKDGASTDIWLDIAWMQQAPNWPSAAYWYANGRRAYLTEIQSRIATVTPYLDKYWPVNGGTAPVPENRPDFNEFAIWSANDSVRSGKPTMFLIHTQEGGGGDSAAENLAKWFQNSNDVSYHYTISQASDGGVTVVDCVDTDRAAWSVGNANSISINLCFAGSRASWTREQWMAQKNAIDVAAYLAVQDAKKYGFAPMVVPPPYTNGRPGISDHRWVTDVFKWGTHTDVGAGFPWDYFTERVNHWANGGDTPAPEPPKAKRFPEDWTDRELLIEILRQLRGYNLDGWPQLGGKSLVDAVAELRSTP